MNDRVNELVEAFGQALVEQNAAIFAGAGLSAPAGYVNWREMMRAIAKDLGLDVDREHDLVAVAQYHLNDRRSRHRINQAIVTELTRKAGLAENHRILAHLPIRTYWTTNYDKLIEQSLESEGKTPDVKLTAQNLAVSVPRRDAVVYKMHGDVSQPDDAVVTKDDYEAYNDKRQLFSTALQGDLVAKTFLFLGFSFTDPNLNYILSRIRVLLGENRRDHYCLMRRVHRSEFSKTKDFLYAQVKQELQLTDLLRYGIIGILVDEYAQITEVLRRVAKRYLATRVFISGSAETYAPWDQAKAREFLQCLSARLVADGYGVVSGFGLGVGSDVINGVLTELAREKTQNLDDRLVLRPFPQVAQPGRSLKDQWREYREDMLARAGIAIFVFGNKKSAGGEIVNADGMMEEFHIATAQGLIPVPVGATGHVAKEIHDTVLADFDRYYGPRSGLKGKVKALADLRAEPEELVGRVADIVHSIKGRA